MTIRLYREPRNGPALVQTIESVQTFTCSNIRSQLGPDRLSITYTTLSNSTPITEECDRMEVNPLWV
jgi:hypothetical protein